MTDPFEKRVLPSLVCKKGHVVYGDAEHVDELCPICEEPLEMPVLHVESS